MLFQPRRQNAEAAQRLQAEVERSDWQKTSPGLQGPLAARSKARFLWPIAPSTDKVPQKADYRETGRTAEGLRPRG